MANQADTFGSEQRAVTADTGASLGNVRSPVQIQEGGVTSIRTPDLSKLTDSQETISNLLGTANSVAQDFFEKKKDQWNIEGQMAYAQGKTQQQIYDSGNAYTMAGFMSMKVRTASNEWYQQAQNDIAHTDLEMSPKDYSKKLSDGFKQLQDSVGNTDDPYTRTMLTQLASQNLPKLAEQQVNANNEFKHQQTINNYTQMLISESSRNDPDESPQQKANRLLSITSPAISGLNTEDHKNAVINATYQSLIQGDNSLANAIGLQEQNRISMMNLGGSNPVLTNAVQHVDGISGGYPPDLGRLHSAQNSVESNNNPNAVSNKGAKGINQVLDSTNADPGFGVKPAQNNSLEERARVGRDYIDALVGHYNNTNAALAAYNWGAGNVNKLIASGLSPDSSQFMAKLPPETQAYIKAVDAKMNTPMGQPVAGSSSVSSTGVNADGTPQSIEQAKINGGASFNAAAARAEGTGTSLQTLPMQVANQTITEKQSMLAALSRAGYTPAQVDKVASGYDQYISSKDTAYNASRTEFESQAVNNVALDGNMPAYLDSVEKVAGQLGLSDHWKSQMAQRGVAAWESGRVQRTTMSIIGNAIHTNQMKNLSEDQQAQGMEIQRSILAGQVANDASVPQDQKAKELANRYMDWLGADGNKLVDKTLGTSIASSLSGNIMSPDGKTISPSAVEAYRQYTYLSDKFTPGYAQSMLPDSIKPLINQAEAMSSGRQDIGSALLSAYNTMNKKDSGQGSTQVVNKDDLKTAVKAKVTLTAPTILSLFGADKNDAMGYSSVHTSDVDKAAASKGLEDTVNFNANALANSPSAANMSPEAIAGQAVADTMNRGARVQGNWIQAAKNSTIMKDMGVNDNRNNAAEFAILNFAKLNGSKMFVPPQAIGETKDSYQKRLEAGSAEWDNSVGLSSIITKPRDEFGNVKYAIGDARLGIPNGIGIHPQAYLDKLPRLNITYDPVLKAVTYQRYSDSVSDVLAGNPVTVPIRLIGQVHEKYMKDHPVSDMNVADKAANAVQTMSPSNDTEPQ